MTRTKNRFHRRLLTVALPLVGALFAWQAHAAPRPAVELIDAAARGDKVRVEALLAAGADPNVARADGGTALMAAARLGRHDLVRALLVHGAHRDQRDAQGRAAFDYAVEAGQSDVIALLRDAS